MEPAMREISKVRGEILVALHNRKKGSGEGVKEKIKVREKTAAPKGEESCLAEEPAKQGEESCH